MKHASLILALALVACAPETPAVPSVSQQESGQVSSADAFLARLTALCGQRFEGKVVSKDAVDADMASQRLTMHVRDCAPAEIRIPFHVGEDKSRTWVVTRVEEGLRLKHDHRHADGTEDVLSQYGGHTLTAGTPERQEFPADAFSVDLFQTRGNPASVSNVWAMEVADTVFAYELRRPERFFRVEFNLTKPLSGSVQPG